MRAQYVQSVEITNSEANIMKPLELRSCRCCSPAGAIPRNCGDVFAMALTCPILSGLLLRSSWLKQFVLTTFYGLSYNT
jgi:hypothetical protein